MPHFPKPFFRRSHGLRYVQLRGRQLNLGSDKEAAFARYHGLMAEPADVTPPAQSRDVVVVVIDRFLDWCKTNRERRTYEWYLDRCQSFAESIPAGLTVQQLKPFHVQEWVDAKVTWSGGMKRGALIAVQRAFNWAVKSGYLDRSRVAHLEKPPAGKRESVITPELYQRILASYGESAFCDLVTLAWETGALPQELLGLEARHVDLERERLAFPQAEAKGKRRMRIIHLNRIALEVVHRLVAEHAEGKLLRNEDGKPWTRFAVNCRFCRLRRKVGRKICLYEFRHSFCHRALKNGVDAVTVGNLMGHRDAAMAARDGGYRDNVPVKASRSPSTTRVLHYRSSHGLFT